MKTFDDLQSIWEDINIEPYTHDGENEITLMTAGDDGLVINIFNKDIDDDDSFHLYDVRIEHNESHNFEIKFSYNDDLETNILSGQHPINQEEYMMLLDIPNYGKRYFVKKSGPDYRPRPIKSI
ncbi:hypothetical protein D1632_06815 [Chryseobacterium nematophagum]|uniref:Uncharacterized protein n=1 Tax=Chryseobacterium nematophagum TaxID=2305228 RepID=A0A3M7L9C0_9FLAO|nr:hypothetical protein [Chryseobacterium nematophagum]RMZ59348.1 hypothetical protein D1632_06815 [Chryseobacterium nematophagum]